MKRPAFLILMASAVIISERSAHAGQCGATCSTVCPEGSCDYLSPDACEDSIADGSTCLVLGGVYHETVSYQAGNLKSNLTFECEDPINAPCVIDGDGLRSYGFYGYNGWVIDGFEIRNVLADGISSIPSRYVAAVRNCYVHDVGGRGIDAVDVGTAGVDAVIEFNRVEHTGNHGIICPAFTSDHLVRNNVVFNAAIFGGNGITCGTSYTACNNARVEHNTVVLADNTAPYGAAPNGIVACIARYNIVVGGNTSISTNGTGAESAYNLVHGWVSAAYAGTAVSTGDRTGDPLFVSREDLHPQAGSPAVNAALSSTESVDFEGVARQGVPDIGALEYSGSHVEDPGHWPVREQVATTPTLAAAPSLVMVPGQGPAMLYFNNRAGACDLVYAERRNDGSWTQETVKSGAQMQDYNNTNWALQPTDLAIDPATGRPAAVWIEQVGTTRYLRFARFLGPGCPTGDCTSNRWRGCTAPTILAASAYTGSVTLAFHPTLHYPAVALSYEGSGGVYRVYYWDYADGSSWQAATVEQNLTGTHFLGRGIDLSFNPATGEPEVAYTRIAKTPSNGTGEVVVASRSTGTFTPLTVALDANFPSASGVYNTVAMAHWSNGDLAVVYSARQPNNDAAIGYMERRTGVWSSSVAPALGHDAYVSTSYLGLDLVLDADGEPALASALGNIVRVSRRTGGDWSWGAVDVRRETGNWVDIAVGDGGELMVGHQRNNVSRSVEFSAESDPGGIGPAAPATCGGGDLCATAACDPQLGCVLAPVDCDDSDACTTDRCAPSQGCLNVAMTCDDGDACTLDGCDPATGCTSVALDCNDSDACTTDRCAPGTGCVNVAITCDDADACTDDSCDPATGCASAARDCADSDPCTVDSCDPGSGCLHSFVDCDDGDACTVDACDGSGGCTHTPLNCDDSDACTMDSCDVATGCANVPVVCDDAEFCTDDSCDTVLGCQFVDNILSCDDGNATTVGDVCLAGFCSGFPAQVVIPTIVESIAVSDTPTVTPPAIIAITETVAVSDTPTVTPPAVIHITETVAVQDSPTLIAGTLPDAGLPDVAGLELQLPDLGGYDRTTRTDAGSGRDSGNARVSPPAEEEKPGCGGDGCRASTPAPSLFGILIVVGGLLRRRRTAR
ncbi:MAG: hypothetical protein ABIJ09_10415 [Pseudomonadota bacterium]